MDEKIFDDFTKRYGGLYRNKDVHLETINSNFKLKQEIYTLNQSRSTVPDVYLGFINFERFTAMAFKTSDKYFIGVSIGAFRSLNNFFNLLMSKPSFMSEVGDSSIEVDSSFELNPIANKYIDHFFRYDFSIRPKCPVRENFSLKLTYKAIETLIMHEFAHITHGHLDYNKQTDFNFMLFEEDAIKVEKTEIRKALEFDADASATTTNLFPFLTIADGKNNFREELILSVVSSYYLFKLNSLKKYTIEDFPYKTYPFPDQRISSHIATISTYFTLYKDKFDFDVEPLIELTGESYLECLTHFSKIFNISPLEDMSLFFNSDQGWVYQNQLKKAWNYIHNDLQKYSFVPLAPIDTGVDLKSKAFDYEEVLKKKG